jgi:hypothetical protein
MTKKSVFLAGLVLMGAAAGALAQEQEPAVRSDDQREQAEATAPRKKIRVLEDPYQISSFYRSRQSRATVFGFDDQMAPLPRVSDNPYAISSYYRSRQGGGGYGYSQFWTSGYGNARGRRLGYGRRIGANGDLFLIAPTIMAPVGPLTGAFDR